MLYRIETALLVVLLEVSQCVVQDLRQAAMLVVWQLIQCVVQD